MKMMTIVAALFAVSSAFASEYVSRKLSFSPRTHHGGTITYYNCDAVEAMAESHLQALGASNVRVSCSGGIEMGWMTPVFVRASFDAVVPGENYGTVQITLKGNESCHLNTEFLDAAIKLFPGVKVDSKRASCSGSRLDRWSYVLTIAQ